MIWQSGPWKLELARLVLRCERTYTQMSRMRDQTWWEDAVQTMQMEKAIFLSAFMVRKLLDSGRLSIQAEQANVSVKSHRARDPKVAPSPDNWDQLDRFYDLGNGQARDIQVRTLVNWIIHSFVFIIEVQSDHAGGQVPTAFYCNSDRSRTKDVVRIRWNEYKRMLRLVQDDDVVSAYTIRDGRGGHRQLRSKVPLTESELEDFQARAKAELDLSPPTQN